jgi:uncharacterized membrane protein
MANASHSLDANMINIAIILTLLVAPYLGAWVFHLNAVAGGRIGICAVFLFAAMGHFFKTAQMMQMLSSSVPARRALIYISGVIEVLFAIAVLAMPNPFYVGLCIIGYLIIIFPSNIYAAVHRIAFGAHSIGPRYLFARLPLQLLLIWWTYWFAVKGQ